MRRKSRRLNRKRHNFRNTELIDIKNQGVRKELIGSLSCEPGFIGMGVFI